MARKFTAEEKAAAKAALKDAEGREGSSCGDREDGQGRPGNGRADPRDCSQGRTRAHPDALGTGCPPTRRTRRSSVFFKDAGKFKDRYATFGFNDKANLDDGSMWPISYALTRLTKADEKKIGDLVAQAVS